ncbi:MAG: GGDEF domain-containing protein [Candidatus Tectimicrobiota bacterium]
MRLFSRRSQSTELSLPELETALEQSRETQALYLLTIRALLYCIKEFSLDLTEIQAERFKDDMDTLCGHFLGEVKATKLQRVFAEYKDVILSYIAREKLYLNDRESEFKKIIEVLTSGLTMLGQENHEFNARIYERGLQLEKITYLNDIRKIKEDLKHEVDQIKHSVQDKQSRDAQRLALLSQEVKSLRLDVEKAEQASRSDGLTGAANRLAFDMHIKDLVERNTVTAMACTMLLLDIDNFKSINDTYGHPVGDRVIMALVQRCRTLIRKDDFLARYGGEEFVILLHGASLRQGLKRAKTICQAVASVNYAIDEQRPQDTLGFTVSIGVSALRRHDTVASFIERADKALYAAKHQGKNRAISETQMD